MSTLSMSLSTPSTPWREGGGGGVQGCKSVNREIPKNDQFKYEIYGY